MKLLKKGQVGGLQGFILSIVTVTIVLAIGLIILQEMATVAKELDSTSMLNESITTAGTVGVGGNLFISLTACRNATNQVVLSTLDCNATSAGVISINIANSTTTANIDYTHFVASAAFNSTETIITKLATVPTWIGIIIIVALAFIVLSFFIGRRQ